MAEPRKTPAKRAAKKTAKTSPKRTATRSSTASTTVPPVSEMTGRTINDSADELSAAAHGWKGVRADKVVVDEAQRLEDFAREHLDVEPTGRQVEVLGRITTKDPMLQEYLGQGENERPVFAASEADRLERAQVARERRDDLMPKLETVDERRVMVETVDRMGSVFGLDAEATIPDFISTGVPLYDRLVYIHGIDPTEAWEPSHCAFDDLALGEMIVNNGCGPWSQSWAFVHASENPGHQTTSSLGGIDKCRTCGAVSPMAGLTVDLKVDGLSEYQEALLTHAREFGVRRGAVQETPPPREKKKSWWRRPTR